MRPVKLLRAMRATFPFCAKSFQCSETIAHSAKMEQQTSLKNAFTNEGSGMEEKNVSIT